MSRRTDQRRAAVFALYQNDVTGRELDDLFERDASTFTRALAYAAQDYVPIPPEGAISEAVETAKRFCGAEAPGFVNGILAAALREMGENGAYR